MTTETKRLVRECLVGWLVIITSLALCVMAAHAQPIPPTNSMTFPATNITKTVIGKNALVVKTVIYARSNQPVTLEWTNNFSSDTAANVMGFFVITGSNPSNAIGTNWFKGVVSKVTVTNAPLFKNVPRIWFHVYPITPWGIAPISDSLASFSGIGCTLVISGPNLTTSSGLGPWTPIASPVMFTNPVGTGMFRSSTKGALVTATRTPIANP